MDTSAHFPVVTHRGGCHCRRVRFEFSSPAAVDALECDCSICRMAGDLHLIVPTTRLRLLPGGAEPAEYMWG